MQTTKVFLSHSSTDKEIVRRIYEQLGAALCCFDEATFDPAGQISNEIYAQLNRCTHFVFFASPTAINSQWVQGELRQAFENWMRNENRRTMVFLLDGASVSQVPEWIRSNIMREPPSYRHILCRIQSELDKDIHKINTPPFYRSNEVQRLEERLVVDTASMPGAILIHGPDGSGRKAIINELYRRQFPGVSPRKLLINTSAYAAERELYRDLIGLTTIATPSEFSEIFSQFDSIDTTGKIAKLKETIEECTKGNQCVIIEGGASILTEEGKIPEWLINLLISLSGKDYPRVAITTLRRPNGLPHTAIEKIVIQDTPELDRSQSNLLFSWWLKSLNSPFQTSLRDVVLDICSGNPKQLELGAKLLVQEGQGNVSRIKPHLLKTLESLSMQFLNALAANETSSTVLAFVANAGYVTRSDLTQYLDDAGIANTENINEAISECTSYGFLIEDDVCLRMPEYMVRGARALGRDNKTESKLKRLWEIQANRSSSIAIDEETTISVLNEHCLAALRSGKNIGPVFESIILPSQCLLVARAMYEREKYQETYQLCLRAYASRAALSKDGLIETLRYMGMACARLGEQSQFLEVIKKFSEVNESKKGERIKHFLIGFNERLDGNYDRAFEELTLAHRAKGEQDLHILRELSFICLNTGDITNARVYLESALSRAPSNQYVLELAIRSEVVGAPAEVAKRSSTIDALLERLYSFDTSPDKIYWIQVKCEYHLSLNETEQAETLLSNSPLKNSTSATMEFLRGKILLKRKKYEEASKLFQQLYEKSKSQKTGQRRSTLPIVCRMLIDATSASDPARGAAAFVKCQAHLPKRVAKIVAKQILEAAAFSISSIPESYLRALRSASS